MQRTYLALAGVGLTSAAALAAGVGLVSAPPRAWAQTWAPRQSLFDAQPVDPRRYAVLGRPLGNGEWNLLVLEQILAGPPCWQQRPDGLVDPSLNRFDYTGICGRYLDSNGYSLRLANREGPALGGGTLRLRLQQSGTELRLLATAPELARELLVGRAPIPSRDRSGFVALRLAPGWELQRRSYQGQALNHLYFAHPANAEQLVAAASLEAGPSPAGRRTLALLPPPPPPVAPVRAAWLGAAPRQSLETSDGGQGRAISLQVIPFRE